MSDINSNAARVAGASGRASDQTLTGAKRRVITYQLSVKRIVGQARRLPIQGMASGSACPTNPLSEVKDQIA